MNQDQYGAQLGQAWGALRQGQTAEAARGFEQILKSDSGHLDALYGLAMTQAEQGQKDSARAAYEKCLELTRAALAANPGTNRFQMLVRMIQQRLHELA
jgi:Tfp pilus assembly protein PilF